MEKEIKNKARKIRKTKKNYKKIRMLLSQPENRFQKKIFTNTAHKKATWNNRIFGHQEKVKRYLDILRLKKGQERAQKIKVFQKFLKFVSFVLCSCKYA